MDSSISYNDDEHIESVSFWSLPTISSHINGGPQHLTKSQALELAYQETLLKTDLIVKDEAVRRLRLRILLLEGENNDLHEQLALADDRIDVLEQEGEELRVQFEETQEDSRRHESELRSQTRELNILKVRWIGSE